METWPRASNLLAEPGHHTTSCGCVQRAKQAAGNPKHGLVGHPLYGTWKDMRKRCYNERCKAYPYYGGRGIFVCDRWNGPDGVVNFIADMAPRPPGTTLHRVDNDGPYSPENCVWADAHTQNAARRPPKNNLYVQELQAENDRLRELLHAAGVL